MIETVHSQSETTPGVAVLYKLMPALSLYANRVEALEQGQQAPFNTSDPADFASNSGQVFDPTSAKQWEAGAKCDTGPVLLTLAYIAIKRPSFSTDPSTCLFGPHGLQRNSGVEFGVAGQPWPRVSLLGGY